jgi:hypothetical protein
MRGVCAGKGVVVAHLRLHTMQRQGQVGGLVGG